MIRKATPSDVDRAEEIYDKIHTCEEKGLCKIGWARGVYPVRATAITALQNGELFVLEDAGKVVATAIINKKQVPEYALANWSILAPCEKVLVLHTLTVDPYESGRGYGRVFVEYYNNYARELGCTCLRIDTNANNEIARKMYKKLGFSEVGIVPCTFNGIENVPLVCLEREVL